MGKAVIVQKSPFGVELEAGKEYWWCACGLSKNQPFCDGEHKGTVFNPVSYTAKKDGTVYFCGCKHTNSAPVCDGTHAEL